VLDTLGPVNVGFEEAFVFRKLRRGKATHASPPKLDEDLDGGKLQSTYSNRRSVFAQVESLWQVVGWSFNCATKWPDRWERWRLLLDFLLDLLHRTVDEQSRLWTGDEAPESGCLAFSMFQTPSDGRNGSLKIMRAIFADGSDKAINEFPEVFRGEVRRRKIAQDRPSGPREKLDIDRGKWGDYDGDVDEDVTMTDVGALAAGHPAGQDDEVVDRMDIINLQARFLSLILKVSSLEDNPFADTEDALDLISEFLRPLPFDDFRHILPAIDLPAPIRSALFANTILPLLSSANRRLSVSDIDGNSLEKQFLTQTANSCTSIEQARLSLLLENLVANLVEEGKLEYSKRLVVAAKKGIDARASKATGDARRKFKGQGVEEEEARSELNWSGERILSYLDVIQGKFPPAFCGSGFKLNNNTVQRPPVRQSSPLSSISSSMATPPQPI
jgi:hypothetical protein